MHNAARSPAVSGSKPGHAAPRRAVAGAGMIIAAIGAAVTGCSGNSLPVSGHGATVPPSLPASATAAPGAATTPTPAPPAPASAATSPAPQAVAVPVLGRPAGVFAHGVGFGQVKPAKVFNGGDPTGLVTHLVWTSWGGSQATGTGVSDYVGQGQTVASGTQKPVTVVGFNLGRCHGTLMYRAVEWYFPGEGQSFDPTHYENICSGTYVP